MGSDFKPTFLRAQKELGALLWTVFDVVMKFLKFTKILRGFCLILASGDHDQSEISKITADIRLGFLRVQKEVGAQSWAVFDVLVTFLKFMKISRGF